ncbi:M16 family metallopeptidase [Leptospira mayottensis]|uniref:Peptidase M16 inactive domain protein n=2 Tax=Leptospira mayottensis TaxID=1137606 RepID=A0AA87SXN3_9LEPT|nr:pitrilysin family protein [Leptospira mayottensis]AXR59395.1 insulinase family protein [Leptospira mayottensis]AXR63177.1 insulinase family protein [Leptospira mayottensis]AZQ01291.1 insulinase family protein [Leptospira mayottensis 200901116]EKS01203.1 peptidase M16 inactive domain protein [Leptospira mayottensis 200901122]TGN14173.1 insulinase family protein [Leptospira mayottensis]
MCFIKPILRLFMIYVLLLSGSLYADAAIFSELKKSLEEKTRTFQMDNGLRVLMMKREDSPTIAIYTKFLVGSADETPEISGTAHLLEHMLFKGTKNIGTTNYEKEKLYLEQIAVWGKRLDSLRIQELEMKSRGEEPSAEFKDQIDVLSKRFSALLELHRKFVISNEDNYIYSRNGGVGFNAYTSNDVTNYQILLPANRLEIWAKLESDRLKNPIFREYYTERDVVLEERRMRVENRGMGILREKYLDAAFPEGHPYRMPVIGYEKNLGFLDLENTQMFFKNYYDPQRMVIAVVGSLDFEKTEKILRNYFGDLKKGNTPISKKATEAGWTGPKFVSVVHSSAPSKIIGFHKPSFPHPDDAVFSVIDTLLAEGESGRLFKKLVLEEQVAQGVYCWNGDPGDRLSNLFSIYITNNQNTDQKKVESLVQGELDRLKTELITSEVLFKIKNQILGEYLRALDDNGKLADVLSLYQLLYGDWKELLRGYEELDTVTPEDVRRVAKKYFVPENRTIAELNPPVKETKEIGN